MQFGGGHKAINRAESVAGLTLESTLTFTLISMANRTSLIIGITFVVGVCAGSAAHAQERKAPPLLIGEWQGQVITEARGTMPVTLRLRANNTGTLGGEIATLHGDWTVLSVVSSNNEWTIRFRGEQELPGEMIAHLTGDSLRGKWSLKPETVGTFALERLPKPKAQD